MDQGLPLKNIVWVKNCHYSIFNWGRHYYREFELIFVKLKISVIITARLNAQIILFVIISFFNEQILNKIQQIFYKN